MKLQLCLFKVMASSLYGWNNFRDASLILLRDTSKPDLLLFPIRLNFIIS